VINTDAIEFTKYLAFAYMKIVQNTISQNEEWGYKKDVDSNVMKFIDDECFDIGIR